MQKRSKRFEQAEKSYDYDKAYTMAEAVEVIKNFPAAKFDESVEMAILLGVDAKKADQAVRGAYSLPNGVGKTTRVIAFVDEANVDKALEAGAIAAGGKELADKIKNEQWFDFDVAIAEPKMMRVVGLLGRVLGPKGLMPSPKAGTVVPDPVKAVSEFAAGKQEYKNDASGNVHFNVGKVSFEADKLVENANAFFSHIQSIKPSAVKGNYIKGVTLSATMSPGVKVSFQR